MFTYLEECKPILDRSEPRSHSSVNVIGYVGRAPISFDLIIDPFFSSLTPLIRIDTVNGKTPSNVLHEHKFMNCTGKLRLIDGRKIYIDTPSTYGFSGGPCFFTSNTDEWAFDGLLTGASRLWNVCTSLKDSKAFLAYYEKVNNIKTDL
jgi:hypothetical protein